MPPTALPLRFAIATRPLSITCGLLCVFHRTFSETKRFDTVISRVRGTLVRRDLNSVEVMTSGGVAYEIQIPLTVYERLPREGQDVELRTHHVVREDSQELFGFIENSERALFGRLLSASGVGPRLALNMLSTLTPDRLVAAITARDIATLKRIPGLGAKKAERLVLELADRLDDVLVVGGVSGAAAGRPAGTDEAVGALVALGYNAAEASAAVRKALDEEGKLIGIDLIKAALAKVTKA
jgi:Holliday junction DNA helicase RuvA